MANKNILIVEDDSDLAEALQDTLMLAGYNAEVAVSAEAALSTMRNMVPDLVLTDVNMPGMDGLSLMKTLRRQLPELPILIMTAFANISDAVSAMQQGAKDYLQKPFEPEMLLAKLKICLPETKAKASDPIAEDPKSIEILQLAKRAAQTDVAVLISGESGTGKEVLARYIHNNSPRCKEEFVAINCAAIPENMLEATLFGYEKGAFTGALKSHPGKFEQAQNSTLLLDEISEMDLALQAKLLRVLQESEVERLGGQKVIKLDVRIIATTNRDLKKEIKEGRFREDLFYRLNVFPLHWTPLRERPKDILALAQYLLTHHSQQLKRPVPRLLDSAKKKMQQYAWPGNTREMDNVIQRALVLQTGDEIATEDIRIEWDAETVLDSKEGQDLATDLKQKEYQVIRENLKTGMDRKKIAEKLGISPRTLRYKLAKMREEGIEV